MMSLPALKQRLTELGAVDWPEAPPIESLWCFEMRGTREEIWPYLSDTSRLNREMGFTPRQQVERDGKVWVSSTLFGSAQNWIEEPWTWIADHTITSRRTYLRGLAQKMHSVFHIESDPHSDRRRVYVYFGWVPSNRLWAWFLRLTSPILEKSFAAALAKLDQYITTASEKIESPFQTPAPKIEASAIAKIDEIKRQLQTRPLNPETIECLVAAVTHADDLDLEPIRVLPLARRQKLNARELLTTCMHATRLGLLKLTWDVICPHCRGSRYSAGSLGDIPESAHCEICAIDFSTSDANSIEVMFHVHPSIRKVESVLYCAAEPAKKNHIKVQQWIPPGREFLALVHLRDGLYRARAIGQSWEKNLEIDSRHPQGQVDLKTEADHFPLAGSFRIRYRNEGKDPVLLVIEELVWENSSLKPAQVLALPEFRDLFSAEHLSANVKLFLGEQTILFTDIVGSTNFYREVGDAKAFSDVRSHFQEVFKEVQAHQGVVVKTIGDAVMASFPTPQEALTAAIAIQGRFHAGRADTSIRLRISIHCGPVIAVQLNTGIDYFGNTVNLAAKIQSCAGAGEIALSESVYRTYARNAGPSFPMIKRRNNRDGVTPTDVYVLQIDVRAEAAA